MSIFLNIADDYTITHSIVNTNLHFSYRDAFTHNWKMDFFEWFKFRMEKDGVSQTALSEAIGVPQPTIQRIMSGETKDPRLSTVDKIKAYFGVPDKFDPDAAISSAPAPLPPEQKHLLDAWCKGGPAKQAALSQLAALPEQEMALILLMLQSIQSKYPPIDPGAHCRENERRAAEKLVRQNLPEPPTEATDSPIFIERRKVK